MAYLATSATPGMSGFGAGRTRPQPIMMVHSTLINKDAVPVKVQVGDKIIADKCYSTTQASVLTAKYHYHLDPADSSVATKLVELEQLAYARSGDKGNNANIGIIAREDKYLPILFEQVTAQAVEDYLSHLVEGEVERFDVPGFNAFNFFLTEALGGGGTASIRVDPQGKAFGQMLLSMKVKVPVEWDI
jgi:hypothetical protein